MQKRNIDRTENYRKNKLSINKKSKNQIKKRRNLLRIPLYILSSLYYNYHNYNQILANSSEITTVVAPEMQRTHALEKMKISSFQKDNQILWRHHQNFNYQTKL